MMLSNFVYFCFMLFLCSDLALTLAKNNIAIETHCSANTILNFTEISKKKTVTNFLAEKIIPIEIHCRANSSDRDIKNTKIVQIAEQNNEQ